MIPGISQAYHILSGTCSKSPQILKKVKPTGKEIGRGAYGRVFEVEHGKTRYAAKELHPVLLQYAYGEGLQKLKASFLNECNIWSTLQHPCIVQVIGKNKPVHRKMFGTVGAKHCWLPT